LGKKTLTYLGKNTLAYLGKNTRSFGENALAYSGKTLAYLGKNTLAYLGKNTPAYSGRPSVTKKEKKFYKFSTEIQIRSDIEGLTIR